HLLSADGVSVLLWRRYAIQRRADRVVTQRRADPRVCRRRLSRLSVARWAAGSRGRQGRLLLRVLYGRLSYRTGPDRGNEGHQEPPLKLSRMLKKAFTG